MSKRFPFSERAIETLPPHNISNSNKDFKESGY
jgi:hypothetical protein